MGKLDFRASTTQKAVDMSMGPNSICGDGCRGGATCVNDTDFRQVRKQAHPKHNAGNDSHGIEARH